MLEYLLVFCVCYDIDSKGKGWTEYLSYIRYPPVAASPAAAVTTHPLPTKDLPGKRQAVAPLSVIHPDLPAIWLTVLQ